MLAAIRAEGRYREVATHADDGAIDFASNDYLGLATEPQVVAALKHAARVGSGGARLLGGRHREHSLLEDELAQWLGRERALLVFFGISCGARRAAGAGADGRCRRLRRAQSRVPDRRDPPFARAAHDLSARVAAPARVARLEHAGRERDDLQHGRRCGRSARRSSTISETTTCSSSTKRTRWALPGRKEPASRAGWTIRAPSSWARSRKRSARMADSSPGRRTAIDLLVNRARSFVFDTALPPAIALAARVAIVLARRADDRRARLAANASRLRAGLRELGFEAPDGISPIVPVVLGSERRALEVAASPAAGADQRAGRAAADGSAGVVAAAFFGSRRSHAGADRPGRERTSPMHRYFVTGTDTDVGKTRVTAALARALRLARREADDRQARADRARSQACR